MVTKWNTNITHHVDGEIIIQLTQIRGGKGREAIGLRKHANLLIISSGK